ncbi:SDR family NAD(P)-dependent oxidoreductase [Pedobacter hartonius]|uniref:Short-chain dehydrogenase n=1 Tax=Pedobacter hartonius TaxID=425514 RepID=A0A1H3XKZ6_9SPHI|nr:SDR family NAD(P)-dependent oxidoreductase [Pedobacter hartonius]SEA00003.1 Short-chain dehydrogenase [Pedobacter hartonius]
MKNIIITGCSSGVGWFLSQQLAKEGHTVYATMRNIGSKNKDAANRMKAWARENSVNIVVVELDISSESSVKTAIDEIALHSNGAIDVLINNAGLGSTGLLEAFSGKEMDHIFQVMVLSPDRIIKAVLPFMHKRQEGLLIQISSRMATFQIPFLGPYAAAKAALGSLSNTYNKELKVVGIDSVLVQIGAVNTALRKNVSANFVENTAISSKYGEWYPKAKKNIIEMFGANRSTHEPAEVANTISSIISTPFGQRKMIYTIGLDILASSIIEINKISTDISNKVIEKEDL